MKASAALSAFNIFLSHSYLDKELILGLTQYLEKMGYTVYVDWRHDTQLSRENVTKETAEVVRKRIIQSDSLFFATTNNAKDSRWMPWELGYMDGKKGKSAILPISRHEDSGDTYQGREYLGIYPYISTGRNREQKERLWVHEDAQTYVVYEAWISGSHPRKHE
ncbi:MAG TPA: TIR domain-containing protein [Bryobacteraceae bacterium]